VHTPAQLRGALLVLAALLAGCAPGVGGDFDGDGSADSEDCGPSDPAIHPGAADACGDALDSDCDGGDGDLASGPWCGGFLATGPASGCGIRPDGATICWGKNEDGQADPPIGAWVDLGVGEKHACALDGDGEITCWGSADDGRLDAPAGPWVELDVGFGHACALDAQGSISCWGVDQLGSTEAPDGPFAQLDVGRISSCALDAEGAITCWGVLGLEEAPTSAGWTRVAAGMRHGCALDAAGSITCWGREWTGLGREPDGTFVDVVAGGVHACGLRNDSVAVCWGDAPMERTIDATFAASGSLPCVIGSDSRAVCWGETLYGASEPPNG